MRLISTSILLAGFLVFPGITLGHSSHNHADETQKSDQPATESTSSVSAEGRSGEIAEPRKTDPDVDEHEPKNENYSVPQHRAEMPAMEAWRRSLSRLNKGVEDFTFEDFPTLHPIVVHVPAIMIPMAFLFGLMSILFTHRHFVMLATLFTLAGLLGGYAAAFPMHPHTRGLPEAALVTLQQHDFFAYSTLGITAFSVLLGAVTLIKPNLVARVFFVTALFVASLFLSVTAHYGGKLTYIHSVGVKGHFLDTTH